MMRQNHCQPEANSIAEEFEGLPFAFLPDREVAALAAQVRAGDATAAIEALGQDIETHEHADNWIKADRERSVLNRMAAWMQRKARR